MRQPLEDRDRRRLFLPAIAAIALAATGLALIGDPPAPQPARPHADSSAKPQPAQAPPLPAAARELPSEESRDTAAVGSRADVEAAKAAVRRFLTGYLPYSYGHANAARIDAAT